MGWGWGAVSSRSFDLLNSMIYDLKRSVDLRQLFDPVLYSSLDDLVLLMFENLLLSWPSFNFDVLCQPVVLQAVTRTEEKMAQFYPRRKDGAENQYSFNSIQYSLLLANIPVLSSLPPASRPITHPIQNETYTFQCSRPLWILF